MQIEYPSHQRWFRRSTEDPLEYLTGKNRKKIIASLSELDKCKIHYKIEPLQESFFSYFTPLYTETIQSKENGTVHDVYAKTLGKDVIQFPYFSLSIFESDTFIGGTIFSMRTDRIAFAFRAFKRDWSSAQIKLNPAVLGEFAIAEFASSQDIKFVSHGRDKNPYGANSGIGLATFKLSVGCRPLLTEKFDLLQIDTKDIEQDVLVLEMPKEGKYITTAYLITKRENEEKYLQVTKYPELLSVKVVYRD